MTPDKQLQTHYTHGGLSAAIDQSLRALGKDPANFLREDLAPIDEFHIGGSAATEAFLRSCAFEAGNHILDVGSGLGGPARAIAAFCQARVAGVDLTPEYVDVA